MPIETIEKISVARSKEELEIMRLIGQWNRKNLDRNEVAGLEKPKERLTVEKIMPFILNAELRQKGMAENDEYAWKADTFLGWARENGKTIPSTEKLKEQKVAA
ncbi:MAG: hypothetical protein AAB566_00140 [Patescibacteria group bacterium]